MQDFFSFIAPVVVPIISGVVGIFSSASTIRKDRAITRNLDVETNSVVAETSTRWIRQLEEKVKALEEEISVLRKKVFDYENRLVSLWRNRERLDVDTSLVSVGPDAVAAACSLGDEGLCSGLCEGCIASSFERRNSGGRGNSERVAVGSGV